MLAHSFDHNIAREDIRTGLAADSWSDDSFEKQLVGLRRCLQDAAQQGINVDYGWTLCREAYDFTTEPVYHFMLLSALLGLWRDVEDPAKVPVIFNSISVRQTYGWSVSARRAEPLALNHEDSGIGWILVPFVWDDMLQLAFESWLRCLGVAPTASLSEACIKVRDQDVSAIDWTPAYPEWNGLLGRAIVGRLRPPDEHEADLATAVCQKIQRLTPFAPHQSGVAGQHLGNTLTHLAKTFTVAHEASHIIRKRQGLRFSSRLDEELDADLMAAGALWNDGVCIASEIREGQPFDSLWVASGMSFFFGLLVYGNLHRSIYGSAKAVLPAESFQVEPTQHEMTVARLRAWVDAAHSVAENSLARGQPAMAQAVNLVGGLLPSLIAYCNALLSYGEEVGPPAWAEARALYP